MAMVFRQGMWLHSSGWTDSLLKETASVTMPHSLSTSRYRKPSAIDGGRKNGNA